MSPSSNDSGDRGKEKKGLGGWLMFFFFGAMALSVVAIGYLAIKSPDVPKLERVTAQLVTDPVDLPVDRVCGSVNEYKEWALIRFPPKDSKKPLRIKLPPSEVDGCTSMLKIPKTYRDQYLAKCELLDGSVYEKGHEKCQLTKAAVLLTSSTQDWTDKIAVRIGETWERTAAYVPDVPEPSAKASEIQDPSTSVPAAQEAEKTEPMKAGPPEQSATAERGSGYPEGSLPAYVP